MRQLRLLSLFVVACLAALPALALPAPMSEIFFRAIMFLHHMLLTIACANSEHFNSLAPSMSRAKS